MKFLLIFSAFAFFCINLEAKILTINEIKAAPKGLARDYYIYRYINEKKVNKKEAAQLKGYIYRYDGKIKTKMEQILGKQKTKISKCKNIKNVLNASTECQKEIITEKFAKTLTPKKQQEFVAKLSRTSKNLANFIIGVNEPDPIKYFIDTNNSANFMRYYAKSSDKIGFLLEINPPSHFIAKLTKHWQFKELVKDVVIGKKEPKLRQMLLNVENSDEMEYEMAFLFGINAILFHRDDLALQFFKSAAKNAKYGSHRDNANFWVYLITQDKNILPTISNSRDINIYSIYSREITGGGAVKIVTPKPKANSLANYDPQNPFEWQKVQNKLAKMSPEQMINYGTRFHTKKTIGEYTYIMQKASNYKFHIYPMPFMEFIDTNNTQRKALILALARQESRFITGAVSTSYALGMMQFMPFLANEIGKKELKIANFDQDDMFKPQIAYKFANHHINYLEKYLPNPLFIAYAYNGGIGFVRRMLERGDLFVGKDSEFAKYEPFISMELVPYAESREYGKKVLANYIIYLAILNSNTKISQFFENLALSKFEMVDGNSPQNQPDLNQTKPRQATNPVPFFLRSLESNSSR